MKLLYSDINNIIKGASILGGGGGGRLEKAKELIKQFDDNLALIGIDALKDSDTIITCFGVGGLNKDGEVSKTLLNNLKVFQKSTGIKPSAVISVEIGPMSVAVACLTAQILNLPLIDADFVGYRSAPEIYIELISLGGLRRTPLVIGNDINETLLVNGVENLEKIEQILRKFSELSESKTYVLGYPLKVKDVKLLLGKGSITEAKNVGMTKLSNPAFSYIKIAKVKVVKQKQIKKFSGFTAGYYLLEDVAGKAKYKIYYKNENLVLLKDKRILVTCPDNIMLVNLANGYGLNNGDNNVGKKALLMVSRSVDLWRTDAGLALFSPKKLGFNFEQKLL